MSVNEQKSLVEKAADEDLQVVAVQQHEDKAVEVKNSTAHADDDDDQLNLHPKRRRSKPLKFSDDEADDDSEYNLIIYIRMSKLQD